MNAQLVRCHPNEIVPGDHINHAGAEVYVQEVSDTRFSWKFTIRDLTTGSVNWVYYAHRGQGRSFTMVWRYQ